MNEGYWRSDLAVALSSVAAEAAVEMRAAVRSKGKEEMAPAAKEEDHGSVTG